MKIALRNFLTTLRRYKVSSLLNIVGLTLAFTACYIILVQVRWEMTYNRTLRDSECIYLIETTDWYTPGRWQAWINRPLSERLIASSPAIEAGGCTWSGFGPSVVLRENTSKMGYDRFNNIYAGSISLSLLDVFEFKSVAGDVHDLKRAQSVIISRSTAEQLGVGIGDMIWCDTDQPSAENAYEVVAIFEDFPQNSLLADCKMAMDLGEESLNDPSEWSYNYFVRLQPGTDPRTVIEEWKKVYAEMYPGEANEEGQLETDPIRLSCIRDLYFEDDGRVPCVQGSLVTTYTLLGIALWSSRWPSSISSISSSRWCPSASARSIPSRSSAPRTPRCASASFSRPWGWSSSPCCWRGTSPSPSRAPNWPATSPHR